MNVLIATTEAVPFAKTGGLADVCGALPRELAKMGQHVSVIMPAFRSVFDAGQTIEETDVSFDIPIGCRIVHGQLLQTTLPGSDVKVYLVQQDDLYDRPQLYQENGQDYADNCERFAFFCRAVMEVIRLLDLKVDVIHCNDWQTGLIPAYLKIEYQHARGYEKIASLLTIHNLAYQGQFWHWDMLLTGLDWKYFNWRQMEFYGHLNLLKTGLVFADAITAVSPSYAEEIQLPEFGCGLEAVLQHRRNVLQGIINGVDYDVWNPEQDSLLPANYGGQDFQQGKAACKQHLQAELGLQQRPDVPVIGLVGRLATQKGWDLVIEILTQWAGHKDVQWAILGTGEPQYHEELDKLAAKYSDRVAAKLTFSNSLAQLIEAGSDMFLMPSRYEPCGLNQLYSLKYGTLPIVRRTGGLADTIIDCTPQNIADRSANGFVFDSYDVDSLQETLLRTCELYRQDSSTWESLIANAMNADWSWRRSAEQYVEMYKWLTDDVQLGSRREGSLDNAPQGGGVRG